MRRAAILGVFFLGACGAKDPVYLAPEPLLMVFEGGIDLEDGMLPAAIVIDVPILEETEEDVVKRQAIADRFGVPLDVVPRARRSDVELEVEWSLRNLTDQNAIAKFYVLAANEFFLYDPTAFVIDPEEDEPAPPLIGGSPIMIEPNGRVSGALREDELYEAAMDLDAISRGGVVAQFALLTRWEDDYVTGGTGGTLTEIPPELVPLLLQLSVSLQTNVQVELSFKLRVRDRSDRVKYPIEPTDVFVPPSTTAFVPAPPAMTP
jgi:hypothetical protein